MSSVGTATDDGARQAEEEGRLVEQAKAGSQEAWAEIYQRHYRPLFRYALARVQDQSVAEDLAATVFLEAVKSIHSYTYRGRPLLAWLYRIAHNVVADHRQREGGGGVQSRLVRFFTGAGRGPAGAQREPAEPGAATEDAERLDLKRALERLSRPQREVIALHYFAGFSLREVARILEKNEQAVYSLHVRALASLRRHLSVGPERNMEGLRLISRLEADSQDGSP